MSEHQLKLLALVAAGYPPILRLLFKPTMQMMQKQGWCSKAPWPDDAYNQSWTGPWRLGVWYAKDYVCMVGFGWSNRAEDTATMLMNGMLSVHDRLDMSAPHPSAFWLKPFERVVTISLNDYYFPPQRRSPHESELAYSCKSAQAHGCGIGLVPHFGLANYLESGIGSFKDVTEELAVAGLKPARTSTCGWAGTPQNHEQRARYGAQAARHPHLLASTNVRMYLPLRAQVDAWSCLVDLTGIGFSAHVPMLLHSGRVLLKVSPPLPAAWVWYEDARAFPEVLTPWDHFVPVKADLSDLVKQARAESHETLPLCTR